LSPFCWFCLSDQLSCPTFSIQSYFPSPEPLTGFLHPFRLDISPLSACASERIRNSNFAKRLSQQLYKVRPPFLPLSFRQLDKQD